MAYALFEAEGDLQMTFLEFRAPHFPRTLREVGTCVGRAPSSAALVRRSRIALPTNELSS